MARNTRKGQTDLSKTGIQGVGKGAAARGIVVQRKAQDRSGLDADWDASWNSAWDISWAVARDAARESARLAARAAAAEATRKAALRAARIAWRNPANDLRRQALRKASKQAALFGRKFATGVLALLPGALRLVLVGVTWVMLHARWLGLRLMAAVPIFLQAVRVVAAWLVRSGRKVAAWGSTEVVDARPRTRIL